MRYLLFSLALCFITYSVNAQSDRWTFSEDGGIDWNADGKLPHNDHIEMSGKKVSVVLRYGISADKEFSLNRSIVYPVMRTLPENTHAHLNKHFALNVADMILVNNKSLGKETVDKITLDGTMLVESDFDNIHLTRILYPSTTEAAYFEKYTLKNTSSDAVKIDLPDLDINYITDAKLGKYGAYSYGLKSSHKGFYSLDAGQVLTFYVTFYAQKVNDVPFNQSAEKELVNRTNFVKSLWSNLAVNTPDPVLNRMFAFAKIRGAESIFDTKAGLMHGPGGESYYSAIWANDQAEYINPFFPFLGDDAGNESSLNSFRHFARFMNPEYRPIPSSIVAEGDDIWHGAGDRGDGAMIAYGAARYALAKGSKAEGQELWPLIEWCLEFCKRKLNKNGVVASDHDELEGRFPAGDANLCTSGLYYDALISAVYLGKDLGKSAQQLQQYAQEAKALRKAIETHFGYTVEGFDTYRYYEGNDILRSWICIPLTMGIYDRADETIKALFSPRLWSDDGLLTQAGTETFWDRSTLYALRGVFAAGETKKGLEYLEKYSKRRLLGDHVPYAIEAWPEGSQRHLSAESGLYCRIFTEGLFGIRPTGLKSFDLTPSLPADWDFMNMKSIKAFGETFNIDITRKGSKLEVAVTSLSGLKLKKQLKSGETLSVKFK